jgi:hypothetical protein
VIRFLGSICFFVFLALGAYWAWETQPSLRNLINENLQTGEFQTLEVRYTAETIMEKHGPQLLKDQDHDFLLPSLSFYPYVLIEVKYVKKDNGTGEGFMLWGLEDGEMVLDTSTWEKSHGFEDCIASEATRTDFRIINTLVESGGFMDRESLLKKLFVENDILDAWIDSVKSKQLVIQKGNDYRLHFQNPNLPSIPETKIKHRLVNKAYKYSSRVSKKYSVSQIENVCNAAFGSGFTIRNLTEVYLPVHNIDVKNPDGSILSTQWNALTGKRIQDPFFP